MINFILLFLATIVFFVLSIKAKKEYWNAIFSATTFSVMCQILYDNWFVALGSFIGWLTGYYLGYLFFKRKLAKQEEAKAAKRNDTHFPEKYEVIEVSGVDNFKVGLEKLINDRNKKNM